MNTTSVTTSRMFTKLFFVLPYNFAELTTYISTTVSCCFIGIIGNIITIITVLTSSSLNSTWYELITSLAISDLVSAIASPLILYSTSLGFEKYNWPTFFCKLGYGTDVLTNYATTMHILWFAILRFVSLQWPHQFQPFAKKYGKRSIFIIWMIAFSLGFLPLFVMTGVLHWDRSLSIIFSHWADCSVVFSWLPFFSWYITIFYPIFYYIPFLLNVVFSFGIIIKVFLMRRKRNKNRNNEDVRESEIIRRKRENQIVVQLALIVGSFLFGYFPLATYHFFLMNAEHTLDQNHANFTWRFGAVVYVLLRFSECLNPIFYNLSSSEMRRETLVMLRKIRLRFTCSKDQNQINKDQTDYTEETRL